MMFLGMRYESLRSGSSNRLSEIERQDSLWSFLRRHLAQMQWPVPLCTVHMLNTLNAPPSSVHSTTSFRNSLKLCERNWGGKGQERIPQCPVLSMTKANNPLTWLWSDLKFQDTQDTSHHHIYRPAQPYSPGNQTPRRLCVCVHMRQGDGGENTRMCIQGLWHGEGHWKDVYKNKQTKRSSCHQLQARVLV